ncbi:hypothetical protein DEDE109153_01055 [Deinococcus deserti]|uniref:Uncharacterized protein n=1 Tax=Deinococcus deserti (strain DSM 17065 / CIP 109153 / LMG 22923 / VCD115) TaxID=546414 RepID=X5H5H6_DEIDV|nr:hypothetical protein [Deinococcus deserti]AHX26515.1 hypothetical protein Deide_13082 [Deinococcus deserti VCD115]
MTGLQWAVLSAYARVLPPGSHARQVIEGATAKGTPGPAAQRVALSVAQSSGMIERGRITEFGRDAARAFLPRLGLDLAKGKA